MSGFVKAIGTGDLEPGKGMTVKVGGRPVAIFNVGGAFHAIDDCCPHAEGPLSEGHLAECVVTCPLHFWEFDVRTGEYLDDPDTKVETFEVKVENGDVLIRI